MNSEEFVNNLKASVPCQGFKYLFTFLSIHNFICLHISIHKLIHLFLAIVNYLKAGVLRQESGESGRNALKGAI